MDWADTSRSFSRDRIWDPAQLAVCGVAVVIGIVCVITHVRQTRGDTKLTEQLHLVSETLQQTNSSNTVKESNNSDPMKEYRYDAYTAWLRAGIFISICFVISWGMGVLDATFFHPTLPQMDNNMYFIIFTAASFIIVLVGYWIIWPMGTVTYGRAWGWHCVLFGIVDGLAESQLFLCIWSAVELFGLPRYGTGLITFFLQGGFKANWDQHYWNVYVAPAHNIEEWNKWKVLFVHVPNVLVTFSYFITYGNATLYCATQTLALIGSTNAMKFPSPFSKYTNPPLQSQVARYADKDNAKKWHMDHWMGDEQNE